VSRRSARRGEEKRARRGKRGEDKDHGANRRVDEINKKGTAQQEGGGAKDQTLKKMLKEAAKVKATYVRREEFENKKGKKWPRLKKDKEKKAESTFKNDKIAKLEKEMLGGKGES